MNQEKLLHQLKTIAWLNINLSKLEPKISKAYNDLAEAYMDGINVEMIKANADTYRYLLSYSVLFPVCAMAQSGALECSDVTGEYGSAGMLLTDDGDYNIFRIRDELISLIGKQPIEDIPDGMQVKLALDTIGLKVINKSDLEDAEDVDDGDVGLSSEEIERMLNGENSSEDDGKVSESDENNTNKIDLEKTDNTDAEAEKAEAEKAEADRKEYIEKIKKVWGGRLKNSIEPIMKSLSALYSSGYSLESPVGVLTDKGVMASSSNGPKVLVCGIDNDKGDIVSDIELYHAIQAITGEQFTYFSNDISEENYDYISKIAEPLTLTFFHIRNTFGHIKFCTKTHSLTTYLKEHNIENNGVKVLKWRDMKGYVREATENLFYEAYANLGVPVDNTKITNENIEEVKKVGEKLIKSIKNVILVVQRRKGVNTRLRICSDTPLGNDIITRLSNQLNTGTTLGTTVKLMSTPEQGVYDINIIYNEKAYSQDALFAYQVVEKMQEQGIRPAWNNVILGKDTNGEFLTYNFKDANNSTIAIYGSKGSGKGVMTLNLVASALADGCDLVYIDGKPDTAVALANVAWKQGLDACVFNGKEIKGAGLEDQPTCIRAIDRFSSRENLPDGLFPGNNEADYEEFISLTIYYRGLELVLKMAEERAAQFMSTNQPLDRWLVTVFDECQQVAQKEGVIMDKLSKTQDARKKAQESYTDDKGNTKIRKINWMEDPVWKFIESYNIWRANIKSKLATALGSTFRKASISVIYIWQTTSFPDRYANDSILAAAIKQEAGSIVKLVGRAALEKNGSTVFGTPASVKDSTWYDEKFTSKNGGYWAIGNDVNKNTMKVFRPFNVYSDASNVQLLKENALAAGMSVDDLIGVSLKNEDEAIPEIGFEGYTNALLGPMGLSAAQQLNIGYRDAEDFVISNGLGPDLLSFMYNAHDFSSNGEQTGQGINRNVGFNPNIQDGEADTQSNRGFNPSAMSVDDIEDGEVIGGVIPQEDVVQNSEEVNPLYNDPRYRRLYQQMQSEMPNQPVYGEQGQGDYQGQDWQGQEDYSGQDGQGQDWQGQDEQFEYPEQGMQGSDYSDAGQWQGYPNDAQTDQHRDPRNPFNASDMPGYNNINSGDGIFSGATGQQVSAKFDEGVYNPNSAYQITNGITFISPISKTQKMGLNERNSVILDVHEDKSLKMHRGGIFRTLRGTEYELKHRWDTILNAVADKQSTVTRVVICNDLLLFNNRQIACYGILGGEEGIEVRDIVNMGRLNKMFPTIKELTIDQEIGMAISSEIGSDITGGLFGLFRNLQILHLLEGSNNFTLTRQSLSDSQSRKDAEKRANKIRLAHAIDGVAALNSTKDRATQGVGVHRLSNVYNNLQGGLAEKFQSNIMKGTTGGLVLGSLAVTGAIVLGVPRAIFGSFRKLIRRR